MQPLLCGYWYPQPCIFARMHCPIMSCFCIPEPATLYFWYTAGCMQRFHGAQLAGRCFKQSKAGYLWGPTSAEYRRVEKPLALLYLQRPWAGMIQAVESENMRTTTVKCAVYTPFRCPNAPKHRRQDTFVRIKIKLRQHCGLLVARRCHLVRRTRLHALPC